MAVTIFKWWSSAGEERIVEFDAVEMEAPTLESAITEYPIESGANLVDHIRLRPVQLRITAVVTNNPARDSVRRSAAMDGIVPQKTRELVVREDASSSMSNPDTKWGWQMPSSVSGYQIKRTVKYQVEGAWYTRADSIQRVQNIYLDLQTALEQAREFTVISETLGEFNQMLIRSVRTERDARAGNSLRLQIEMQQLRYATLLRRNVSGRLPAPVEKRSKPKAKLGTKPAPKADAQTERAAQDHASSLRDLLNGGSTWATEGQAGLSVEPTMSVP